MPSMPAGIEERLTRVRTLAADQASPAPAMPRSAKIELTSACDLDCVFCAHTKHPRSGAEMSPLLFVRLARELREAGVEDLGIFYMGESMLCRWLPEAIDYAKRELAFPYVFLTTNGLKATTHRVRACMSAGLDSLKFALNFSGRTQLRELAHGNAREIAIVIRNVKEARRIRDELDRLTGRRCALYASSLAYDDGQRGRMTNLLEAVLPCVDAHYWLPFYGPGGLPRKSVPCWSLFTEAHITCEGKLSACALDASPRFHMGDLTTTSFRDAWHSAGFRALRAAHLAGEVCGTVCENCIDYRTP